MFRRAQKGARSREDDRALETDLHEGFVDAHMKVHSKIGGMKIIL